MIHIYLRPLVLSDALISYKWRNIPKIWELTGNKPNRYITSEIETNWLKNSLIKVNEKRFAICIQSTNQYMGNIQLTNIEYSKAEFHIFIGEIEFWGQGIAYSATKMMLSLAFEKFEIREIHLEVSSLNIAALKVYQKCGFVKTKERNDKILMVFKYHK